MAKIDDLTVEVKTKLVVPRHTAETCLALLSEYLNSHPNVKLMCNRNDDGSYRYYLEG